MRVTGPAATPQPPYYAVIFTSVRQDRDNGYAQAAQQMLVLASEQPGFGGFETARGDLGMSVSYWSTTEGICARKANTADRQAKSRAKDWYKSFRVRICRVEREYGFQLAAGVWRLALSPCAWVATGSRRHASPRYSFTPRRKWSMISGRIRPRSPGRCAHFQEDTPSN